jgi:hypothetical protein
MPFVKGFLKVGGREGGPVDPGWGIEEGGGDLDIGYPLPDPPPGIWPPLTPEHPWRPLPPGPPPVVGGGPARPERPVDPGYGIEELPPGTIWPPLPPGVEGKFLALVLIAGSPGVKYRYVVIDASLRPDNSLPGGGGARPHPENPIAPTPSPKAKA